mmetsp:Transcript_28450/g.51415  ORF Transcript_28450/g.51415 Transcript_28450/m.51415 type:complete len:331 (+) Transcript_28450:90-1082(+)
MAQINWDILYTATNKDNKPTPGFVFNEITQNVASASPADIPAVADYLADCVDGDHAHVKLKALFVIKTLAYRIPPFCQAAQRRIDSVKEAAEFTGPPSDMFGDEPYRLVREAAEGALQALTAGEFYHEQYKEMSQRIVGFGNYQPPEETLHPDGSINLTQDVTTAEVVGTAIGIVRGSAGLIMNGFASLFSGTSQHVGLELDGPAGVDVDDVADGAEQDQYGYPPEEDEEEYHGGGGSYMPPVLPIPSEDHGKEDEGTDPDGCFATAVSLLDQETEDVAVKQAQDQESEDASMLRVLGISGSDSKSADLLSEDLPEEAILDILGINAEKH